MKRLRNMLRFDSSRMLSNRAARAVKYSRRLRVEQLEDRAMLSGVSLLGDADTLSSGGHLVEPPTIAEGDSQTVIGPHHADPDHEGTQTHFFAETGDDHHFAWLDQDPSTEVIDIYYDFRDEPGRWGANQITDSQKAMAVSALQKWALATGGKIQFTLMETGSSDNIINIGTGNLKALHPSFGSGPGGILGLGGGTYTHDSDHSITGGVAWMDSAEDWINDFDYFTVVAQEIGHALGLGHSQDLGGENIMNGTYTGAIAEYSTNDSEHIQSVYGESGPINEMPTVIISSPADGLTFSTGASISFVGTANDAEDGVLTTGLVWTSNIDGMIGSGGSFSTTLSDGIHIITASVTDSGEATGGESISITVGDAPVAADIASVDSISYATEGGKNNDKHLLDTVTLVDDLGNPVSGASVSIDLFRDGSFVGSGTGTTGTSGTVTFSLKNAADGCYTTAVTAVTAAGLTWNDATPTNELAKGVTCPSPLSAASSRGLVVSAPGTPATIQATINDGPEDRTEPRTARETLLAALAGEQDRIPSSHHFSARSVDLVLSGYETPTEDGLTTELALELESSLLDQIFENLATAH